MPTDDPSTCLASVAYLVLREELAWRDIHKLVPGHTLTVGRIDTNRVVLDDTRCSRRHCEVTLDGEHWMLRDLNSSNGTEVNGVRVEANTSLREGDVIRIGAKELLFTTNISQPMNPIDPALESATDLKIELPDAEADGIDSNSSVLERKSRSVYHQDPTTAAGLKFGLADLYRLVVEMVSSDEIKGLANVTLQGLVLIVKPDIGAVLLLDKPTSNSKKPKARDLRLQAFQAPEDRPYNRVSDRLSTIALQEGDGILALDFGKGSEAQGAQFETLASMNARSVICVPVRDDELMYGLIHLYSLNQKHELDVDALEFALGVAEQLARCLKKLYSTTAMAAALKVTRDENNSLRHLLRIESDLIGESIVMQQLRSEIARYAMSDQTVLINGESGAGKELVARAIHFNSNRKPGPFVCVNCAALTESLLESELFGHEKGSFTGATERKIGKFEQAAGGTLFLDEIAEMSPTMQAKFLRVLEGHAFERVGGQTSVKVDVRVVAATNRDLPTAVRDGSFRRDLFFRINILTTLVPPLRDRREDVSSLVLHFVKLSANRQGRAEKTFSNDAMQAMQRYDWPGNVRELRNVVERGYTLAFTDKITLDDIHFSNLDDGPVARSVEEYAPLTLSELEKRHIAATLGFTKWVKREAARILDIERSTLDRKLQAYDIQRPAEK